ncbi:hypothetical protein KIPB_010631, partial [Kipferlia bialata]|eukprot:g10631.t1
MSSQKQLRIEALDVSSLPPSYSTLSVKEEVILEYIQHFESFLSTAHVDRRKLFIAPLNEGDLPRFVCTTIRPTLTPHKELYNVDTCARFVSDAVSYEPLQDPTNMPDYLVAPATCLEFQAGDSFDMSVLLVSLLAGAGYDAYVVVGYAAQTLTTKDRTHDTVPQSYVDRWHAKLDSVCAADYLGCGTKGEGSLADNEKVAKYLSRRKETKKSKYLTDKRLRKKRLAAGMTDKALEAEIIEDVKADRLANPPKAEGEGEGEASEGEEVQAEAEPEAEAEEEAKLSGIDAEDPLLGRRVHAWVYVAPGRKNPEKTGFFIDAPSGKRYELDSPVFLGLEAVFCQSNYWVNLQ